MLSAKIFLFANTVNCDAASRKIRKDSEKQDSGEILAEFIC